MAIDYRSILSSLQSGTGLGTTSSAGTTTPTTTTSTSSSTTPTQASSGASQAYLNQYNANREQQIRDMYASNLDRNKQQLQTAYDQSLSAAEQARDKIPEQYQTSRNEIAAEYERQRRNNNMQAAANGLNTGAGSQMQLAQSNVYQTNTAANRKAENEAVGNAEQGIVDLKTNYQNQIAQATANNDYQLAAALLDEYGAQYERQMTQASQLAEFGDFSLYASIYGDAAAQNMERTWAMQNPEVAYGLGKISADEYFNLTGKYPGGQSGLMAAYGGYGGRSYGGGGGGGNPSSTPTDSSEKANVTFNGIVNAIAKGYSLNQIKDAAANPQLAEDLYVTAVSGRPNIAPASGGARSVGALRNSKSGLASR